jgi:protease-4
MSSPRPSSALSWFGKFWGLLDASRRLVLNLLFLAVLVALVVALFKSGGPSLSDKTALVLNLQGVIVEQHTDDLRATALAQARGQDSKRTTQLRDVLTVLEAAAKDSHIERVVLVLDEFQGAGLATLREVAAALDRFKASGKTVVAWGSGYDQRQYFLASHANEVWLHPMGMVFLEGFGRYRNYYRDALDRVGVTVNLIRVGTYKSAAEPFIANASSSAAKEADGTLYKAMWSTYTDGVEKARKLPAGALMAYIDEAPARLAAVSGDAAKMAVNAKLVDGLKTRDELRDLLIQRGAKDSTSKSFRQVSLEDYLARQRPTYTGDAVGVVVAEGEIIDGTAPAGQVGGKSTADLIRKAREDDDIKAIVLRVNSPGGSAFGSELIRRELELTRQAGKPVVVSMGDLAASGGYWISMASDQVMADPGPITGSIGVFALLATADKALDKLGVHTDGVTTTWLGSATDPRRPLNPRFGALVQSSIDHVYADFTAKVAQARKTTPQKIDEVAQGRVWTGAQAKERGLVDNLGSYGDALKAAAVRAKLSEGYRVAYVERDQGRMASVLRALGGEAGLALAHQLDLRLTPLGASPELARDVRHDLGMLTELAEGHKPFTVTTHCLCGQF